VKSLIQKTILVAAATTTFASQGLADDAAGTPARQADATFDEVIVTGSRIATQDYKASSPISTVSATAIESTGAVTLEGALNQLPQFAIGANQTNAGFGGTGQASVNLRGLGVNRNLVLLDGRRLQPSDVLGWIDVNTIPTALIRNVEIITGGASAVYGSDAIAGVVNVQLVPDFEGIKLDTQYNAYDAGDGSTWDLALTAGGNFADGRGNGVVSLSYTEREDVDFMARSFFRQAQGGTDFRLPTGIYRPNVGSPANLPSQAAIDAVFGQYGAAAGRVPRTSVLGYNDDGTLFAANNGPFNYRGPDGLLYNTGTQLNNLNQVSRLQIPLTRYSAFGKATFELAPSVSAFGQIYFTTYDSLVNAEAGNDAFNVPVTNPWIPQDLATLLASRPNPLAPFRFEKRFQEEAGPRNFDRTFDAFQFLAGVRGDVAQLDGTWEVYASQGETQKVERNQGSVLIDSLKALLESPDGGRSLCAGGYDPFGLKQLSDDCHSFLVATPVSETTLEQSIVEANLQGRLWTLPAGDLRFATGIAYRKNSYEYLPDQDLARGNVVGVFRTGPSSGEDEVAEIYGELRVPVLRDTLLIENLEFGLAYRYSDYDLAGGVDTYKADFSWTLADPVRIRGGYNRAVRAPSVGELFVAPNVAIPTIGTVASGGGDPCSFQSQARTGADAAAVSALCVQQGVSAGAIATFVNPQDEVLATNSGNTALSPETGDTYTLGLVLDSVFEADLLSGLRLSLDWYDIEIEDAIGTIGVGQILPKCYNQDGSNPTLSADNFYCQLIRRDAATGWFANVTQPTLNLGGYHTSGIDLQLDWSFGLGAVGLDDAAGTLTLSTLVNHVQEFEVTLQQGSRPLDYAGTVGNPTVTLPGSIPSWKAVTRFEYGRGPVSAGVRWRFIDGMENVAKVTNPASTIPDVPSFNYFDLYAAWELSDSLSVSGGVNNVADEDPPVVGARPGVTQTSTYDIYGPQYFLSANFKF
jgi:iron complex outermembrane recepter protein